MRIVNHLYRAEDRERLVEHLQTEAPEAQVHQLVYQAIGYLSTWASDGDCYAMCTLTINGNDEIIATYRDPEGKLTYQIGAVWNGTGFGFHS